MVRGHRPNAVDRERRFLVLEEDLSFQTSLFRTSYVSCAEDEELVLVVGSSLDVIRKGVEVSFLNPTVLEPFVFVDAAREVNRSLYWVPESSRTRDPS